MANQEFLRESLEHFKQQKAAKMEELRSLEITIHQIQKQIGEIPDERIDVAELPISEPKPQVQVTGSYKPRADEFFGMSQADAARAYLEKVGHAVSLDDILRAIISGGGKVGGADPKRTLSMTISQRKRDFVSTGGGNFGLRKFYPNMPKLGRPEGTPSKKTPAKHRARRSARRRANPKMNAGKLKTNNPVNVNAAKESQVVQ